MPSGAFRQCPGCGAPIPDGRSFCPPCLAVRLASDTPTTPEPSSHRAASAIDFSPGTVFAARYTIIEKAGEGGMGIVYKAIDRTLGGSVALKLVQPGLATDPSFLDRFKREVRLTRQVSHRNVCRVHDIGESEGVLYLSMEWIEGETLRRLLNQAGVLERDRVLRIIEKIALALDAAHARGIIHRDLKPENVMIDASGEVFVLDFGLAVLAREGGTARGGAGTRAYMSPEQLGGGAIDARADLYALGLMLGELLTGERPDTHGPRLPETRSEVGRQITDLLSHLTAQDPDARFRSAADAAQSVHAVRQALSGSSPNSQFLLRPTHRRRRLLAGLLTAAALILTIGAVYYALLRPEDDGRPPGVSAEAWARYRSALDNLDADVGAPQKLENSIQMFHRAILADPNFSLAWAGLGRAYWSRYRLTQDEAFKQEARKAVQEALRLDPKLPEAHAALALGYQTEGNYPAAKAEFEAALAQRPDMDWAWARLGSTCGNLGEYAAGLAALNKAIALNPNRPLHYLMLGSFHDRFSNYGDAAEAYRRAARLDPGNRMAWNNLGGVLLKLRETDAAADALRRALALADNGSTRANLGMVYFIAGKYAEATQEYGRAIELQPDKAVHWGNRGDALTAQGKSGAALDAYRKASSLALAAVDQSPLDPSLREERALYCARAGDMACALKEGQRAYELQGDSAEIVFTNALIRCLAGKDDEALDWLERSVKLGLSRVEIENELAFSRLEQDPRYVRVLQLAR
jgi:serine/threonine-protein kinase